jgi:hypothetical protein
MKIGQRRLLIKSLIIKFFSRNFKQSSNNIIIWVFFIILSDLLLSNPLLSDLNIGINIPNKSLSYWHQVNRLGVLTNTPSIAFSLIRKRQSLEFALKSIIYNNKWNKSLIQIGYLSKKINDYELKVGRWSEKLTSESILSTGSLIRGNNTIPIPQITFLLPNYKKIQILKTQFFIKGGYSHGWLSKGSYIKAPFLHEKYFYLKKHFNNQVELEVGIFHEAIWGGQTIEYGLQPQNFSDYLRVVFGQSGSKDAYLGEQINVLGNHLGIWDVSIKKIYHSKQYKFYFQHPFEDKSGAFQYFFDELKQFKISKNSFDGLFGFELIHKDRKLFSTLVYEYLNTMHQSGSLSASKSDSTYGRDNYFNHYIYQSGWTYKNKIIGNPLFSVGNSKSKNQIYIINNRIKSHHIGVSGYLKSNLRYKILLTKSKNYGTYDDRENFTGNEKKYQFYNSLNQTSALFQFDFIQFMKKIDIQISYAIDRGSFLKDSDGFQLSINYNFSNLSYSQ